MKLRFGGSSGGGEESYRKLHEFGYQCADYQMNYTTSYLFTCSHSDFEKKLRQEKAWADANEIEIHQMHGPWDAADNELEHDLTPERLKTMLDARKRSIEACTYLGCKNWVIHPIFPYGREDEKVGKSEEAYRINFEFYSELLETAREFDVTICFENMPFYNFCLNNVDKIKKFICEIDDDHFKACLDTGHVICLNDRTLGDAVRTFGKDLKVLHVHDSRPGQDLHMMPYFGYGDWDEFYNGLSDIGYGGVLNLETAPPGSLSPMIYDEMSKSLVKIAKQIIRYDE